MIQEYRKHVKEVVRLRLVFGESLVLESHARVTLTLSESKNHPVF
jgi:hypothetical protein